MNYNPKHLDELACEEERHFWFKHRRKIICDAFLKYVCKDARILEIGGGTGFVAEGLQKLGFRVEMSDLHQEALEYAKQRGIEKLHRFDLFQPPFAEEFDAVGLFDVLEHLSDAGLALECIKKIVKPNGLILLTVPAHQWLWCRDDEIAGHVKRYTKKDLTGLFAQAGLANAEIRYFFVSILPFLLVRKWVKRKETLDLSLPPLLNRLFGLSTRLDHWLPSLAGGSILAVARKPG